MSTSVHVDPTVNGEPREADVEARLLLVHWLRDELGLTGTHVGCDTTNCGACAVHHGFGHQKFTRRAEDWAMVGVCALANHAQVVAGAVGRAAEDADPPGDLNATPEYTRHLGRVLTRRAVEEAVTV